MERTAFRPTNGSLSLSPLSSQFSLPTFTSIVRLNNKGGEQYRNFHEILTLSIASRSSRREDEEEVLKPKASPRSCTHSCILSCLSFLPPSSSPSLLFLMHVCLTNSIAHTFTHTYPTDASMRSFLLTVFFLIPPFSSSYPWRCICFVFFSSRQQDHVPRSVLSLRER